MVVDGDGIAFCLFRADRVFVAGSQRCHQNVIEGLCLLGVVFKSIVGQIHCAIEDQPCQILSVEGGVGLRVLCAITFTIQPEFFVANDLAEYFEVFHSLPGAEIGKELCVAQFIDTIRDKGAGIPFECPFLAWGESSEIRLVILACSKRTGEPAGHRHTTLVEEYDVKGFKDAFVEP